MEQEDPLEREQEEETLAEMYTKLRRESRKAGRKAEEERRNAEKYMKLRESMNARRKAEEERRKAEEERRKAEEEILAYVSGHSISPECFDSLSDSGKSLSDLLQYSSAQLVSEFNMELEDATKFVKHRTAKRPRHDSELRDLAEVSLAHKCFRVAFKGTAHMELHERISHLRLAVRKESHYSPYCALVQSSGVGKSRALMELSKVGVYICYCSLASSFSTSSPPRTGGLADKLVTTFTEHDMVFYLKAWLHVLAADINGTGISPEVWKEQQLPTDNGSPQGDLAERVLDEWRKLQAQSGSDDPYKGGVHPDTFNLDICSEAIKSVGKALSKKRTRCSPCTVIFAFDEARGLQIPDPKSKLMSESPFYQIRRALRIFFGHPLFFAIMLDTSAKVSNRLPTKHNENSDRAIRMGFKLPHPIYFLPNMALFKPTGSPSCFKPVHWMKQGRPMWSARLKNDMDPFNTRQMALQKLVRTLNGKFQEKDVDVLCGIMTESQAIALLSAAAGLSICARSELAETMSASHMSLILRVSEDRSRIYIGLPAEPILAEAAASALQENKVQEGALMHLHAACKGGYVTAGPRGEFVAKFILVAAMWVKEEAWKLRPIPVDKYLEKLLVSSPRDQNTFIKLKAKCPPKGIVFFNSFVLVRKPPTTATLKRAFASGYAIMYRAENNLPGVDMIIPVLTPSGMTCIVVSVKNLQQSGWLEEVSIDKVRSEFTKVEVKPGLICITIVMSMREPVNRNSGNWLLWLSPDGEVASGGDPYTNLTCYGIDNNYNYLDKKVKELLKAVLITVPDELAGATEQEKAWIRGMLPEQYK